MPKAEVAKAEVGKGTAKPTKAAKTSLEATVKAALGPKQKVRVVCEDLEYKLYYGTEYELVSQDTDGLERPPCPPGA